MSRPLFIRKDNEQKTVSDGWVKKNGEFKKVRLFFFRENGQWVHDHKFDAGVETTPASCTSTGTKTYTCACKECQQETIPALGHRWNAGVVTTSPGCSSTGIRTYTCLNDNSHTQNESIPATGNHDFTSLSLWSAERQKRSAATCTEPATYWYECRSCFANTSPNGNYFSGDDVSNGEGPLGHDLTVDSGEVTIPATCQAAALHLAKCSRCDYVSPDTADAIRVGNIDPYNHYNTEYRAEIKATCTTDGRAAGYKCTACGVWASGGGVIKAGHKYNSGTTTSATCTTEGYTTKTCTVCGHSYTTNTVPATGHTYTRYAGLHCNNNGTHSKIAQCANCTATTIKSGSSACSASTPATCTTPGTCECGYVVKAALGHKWVNGVCTRCSTTCSHVYSGTGCTKICRTCGMTRDAHVDLKGDGICDKCGAAVFNQM